MERTGFLFSSSHLSAFSVSSAARPAPGFQYNDSADLRQSKCSSRVILRHRGQVPAFSIVIITLSHQSSSKSACPYYTDCSNRQPFPHFAFHSLHSTIHPLVSCCISQEHLLLYQSSKRKIPTIFQNYVFRQDSFLGLQTIIPFIPFAEICKEGIMGIINCRGAITVTVQHPMNSYKKMERDE